jgi:hypothetical protein
MAQCKSYKNKTDKIQCPNKIKTDIALFCGKHKNNNKPDFDNNGILISNKTNTISNISISNNIIQSNTIATETHINNNNNNNNTINNILNTNANANANANAKYNVYKSLESSDMYVDYLLQRKNYIRENNKYIELVEYIENSKLDYYPNARILASLEYYKLIKKNDVSKFMLAINNINLLVSLFETLLNVNLNLNKIIKLQKWIKKSLNNFKAKLRGPALYNRALCVNDSDFVSLDDIKDIPEREFISFKDDTDFIYGFHIDSIIELIFKTDENYYENFKKHSSTLCYKQFIKTLFNHYNKMKIFNPYTRFIIDGNIKLNIIRLYAQLEYKKKLQSSTIIQEVIDIKTSVRNKCFAIFQKIDFQGYFTDTAWLLDEMPKTIKLFYKKLASLWNFEFGLNNTARYKISKTHNLFENLHDIMISRADKYSLLDKILDTVNILISNGEGEGDKNTGCILVLYGLAFINHRCIQANPWLA